MYSHSLQLPGIVLITVSLLRRSASHPALLFALVQMASSSKFMVLRAKVSFPWGELHSCVLVIKCSDVLILTRFCCKSESRRCIIM